MAAVFRTTAMQPMAKPLGLAPIIKSSVARVTHEHAPARSQARRLPHVHVFFAMQREYAALEATFLAVRRMLSPPLNLAPYDTS